VVPRTDIGQHGFYAVIHDTEGNRVALHAMV
jgi:predicted enzyme related to lactoylglutathione lyase